MTTVPPGSISLAQPPDRVKRIKPAGGVPSTVHVLVVGPGSVAVTVTEAGVPAPAGMATLIEPIAVAAGFVALVTVIVYDTEFPTIAVVGLITAVYTPVFCTLIFCE